MIRTGDVDSHEYVKYGTNDAIQSIIEHSKSVLELKNEIDSYLDE